MATTHSLKDLKRYHKEATNFFAAELMMLKEAIPKIVDEKLAKVAIVLISSGQTGAALLQLASQTDTHTGESVMLARSFMEKVTNFCYVCVCDEKEYRAFVLHPIYKHYHKIGSPRLEEEINIDTITKAVAAGQERQRKLKEIPIVQEALAMFSETKNHLNWSKKTVSQKIGVIKEWGKVMDLFFSISNYEYYSDASEALHGSLYGCTFNIGVFDSEFDRSNEEEIDKKLYKDSTLMLLNLGTLIHEALAIISYTNDIQEIYEHSYQNRTQAMNLSFHVMGRKIPGTEK